MNLVVWILPPVVAACALALTVALRSLAEEAAHFGRGIRELDSVRLAIVELRSEADRARETLARTGLR